MLSLVFFQLGKTCLSSLFAAFIILLLFFIINFHREVFIFNMNNNQEFKIVKSSNHYQGRILQISHWSKACNCFMNFNIFLPYVKHSQDQYYHVLFCLAGLGSNCYQFPEKSGFGVHANKYKWIVVFPDVSPRNLEMQDVKDHEEGLGYSASFYVDATSEKYSENFKMFTYITQELPTLVNAHYPTKKQKPSLIGWSMGGMGALLCAFKTKKYESVSAFSPIVNPFSGEKWARKAFKQYFINWEEEGISWDPVELVKRKMAEKTPLLVDYGSCDEYDEELKTRTLIQAMKQNSYGHIYRERQGYDHSYYYLSTFLGQHFEFHASYLKKSHD